MIVLFVVKDDKVLFENKNGNALLIAFTFDSIVKMIWNIRNERLRIVQNSIPRSELVCVCDYD